MVYLGLCAEGREHGGGGVARHEWRGWKWGRAENTGDAARVEVEGEGSPSGWCTEERGGVAASVEGEPKWVEEEGRAGADALGLIAGERGGSAWVEGAGRGEPERVGRGVRADPPRPVASTRRGGGREVGAARRGVSGGDKGCACPRAREALQSRGRGAQVGGRGRCSCSLHGGEGE